jgi:hypothetical protein
VSARDLRIVPDLGSIEEKACKIAGYDNPALQAKLDRAKKMMGRKHCLHPKTTATLENDVLGTWKAKQVVKKA